MRKIFALLSLIISITLLQFCTSTKKVAVLIDEPKVTYLANIQPVVLASCSPCHIPPKGRKKALDTFDSMASEIDEVISRIQKDPEQVGFMPLKHSKLSDSTINLFVQWRKQGLREK